MLIYPSGIRYQEAPLNAGLCRMKSSFIFVRSPRIKQQQNAQRLNFVGRNTSSKISLLLMLAVLEANVGETTGFRHALKLTTGCSDNYIHRGNEVCHLLKSLHTDSITADTLRPREVQFHEVFTSFSIQFDQC